MIKYHLTNLFFFFYIIQSQQFLGIYIYTVLMKQNKANKIDLELFQKIQINESNVNLSWVLKFPNCHELQSSILQMPFIDLHIEIQNYDIYGACHIIVNNQIQYPYLQIAEGMLVYQKKKSLFLSDCVIEKKKFLCNQNQLFLIKISNNQGRLILVFVHPISQREWFKILKLSAKQNNFLSKYRINEILMSNIFSVLQKRKNKKYVAQIFKKKDIKQQEQYEIINNYIKILRSGKIINYYPVLSIFDDSESISIITYQFYGTTLESLLMSSQKAVPQSDLAFIFYSILQSLRSLQDEELFHGHICLENIVMANVLGSLQIYLINSNYKPYNVNNLEFYLNSIPNYLLAPEIQTCQDLPSVKSDIYQLGMIFLMVSFYAKGSIFNRQYISKIFQSRKELIKQQEVNFQKCRNSDFPNLYSACQLDLIKKMIENDPDSRISVNDAIKHAWFINTKDKLKSQKIQQMNRNLPSLRTIIEMVEQSEQDIRRKSFQVSNLQCSKKKLECATSIQQFDFNAFQQQQDTSPIAKSFESQNEIIDEEHEISNLILNLNNKQYRMMPSFEDKNQYQIVQPQNQLPQFQD
ncbi:unnamed protein product [Paramecium sonneborni]|uniref:Protein kinase domain-containing protein n=1 Tax=Paramecium sonneborni TaxID=65129 RepID=A0A8S1P0L0_9CILI|nr:unnamed protein product [Paramecium sonneborni]